MAEVTVKRLAVVVGMPVQRLLSRLTEAGMSFTDPEQIISDEQRQQLLNHLQGGLGAAEAKPRTIIRKRKQGSSVTESVTTARSSNKVKVEVRKKRTIAQPVIEAEVDSPEEQSSIGLEPEIVDTAQQDVADTAQAALSTEETAVAPSLDPPPEAKVLGVENEPTKVDARTRSKGKTGQAADGDDKTNKKAKRRGAEVVSNKLSRHDLLRAVKAGHADDVDLARKRGRKRGAKTSALHKHAFEKPTAPVVHEVTIPEVLLVSELAQKMSLKATEIVKILFKMGVTVTVNQTIDQDTAVLVVEELGHKARPVSSTAIEDDLLRSFDDETVEQITRAPIVTIMGHVDHGKTSLLDYIRRTRVTAAEAGGITQHIGAYHVQTQRGSITFLDTPGHEAFTAMRARGAQCTDIVVLVVAADDGVMPQTIEAIQHAKAAGVPIVVAINKIDKEEADPDKIKTALSQYEVIPEAWGGETMFVEVSAKTGLGIDDLLETLSLQAEVLELKAPVNLPAKGVVVESRLDKNRGTVATLIVQLGQLRKGDILLTGTTYGKVRAMFNEVGEEVMQAGPSTPVEILGLTEVPSAGDDAMVVADDRKAREVASYRLERDKKLKLAQAQATNVENLFSQLQNDKVKTLHIVLKADVQGSVEAIRESLSKLNNEEVAVKLIASGVGGISESDVNLARTSNAMVIGFNVRADSGARGLVEREGLMMKYYSVIYHVLDDIKQLLSGMLDPKIEEKIVGTAQVRDVFRSSKIGAIAGCMVQEGLVKRNRPIRVLRDNIVIYEGELESLRRFKEDVSEVRNGMECGIGVKHYNDVKVGDQIEVFEVNEITREL